MAKKTYLIKTKYGDFSAKIWYDKTDKVFLVETVQFDRTMTFDSTLVKAKQRAKSLIEFLVWNALEDGKLVMDEKRHLIGKSVRPGVLTSA